MAGEKNIDPHERLDKRLAKSIAHDIRLDLLRILYERMASPKELADFLNEGLSHLSYHIRELRDYGNIELVRTEPRRGAIQHYYRATTWPFVGSEEAKRLPKSTREQISATVLQAIISEAVGALHSGTFDSRTNRHVSWMPGVVNQRGFNRLMELQLETLERAQAIIEESAEDVAGTGQKGIEVIVSMMGFERSKSRAAGKPPPAEE